MNYCKIPACFNGHSLVQNTLTVMQFMKKTIQSCAFLNFFYFVGDVKIKQFALSDKEKVIKDQFLKR